MLSRLNQLFARFFVAGCLCANATSASVCWAQAVDEVEEPAAVVSEPESDSDIDDGNGDDAPESASADEKGENGPIYWATRTLDMRFGLTFSANDNYCTNLHATLPFPMTWPEQEVELLDFEMPEFARYHLRPSKQGVGEIIIDMQRMNPNDVFDVFATVRIKKSFIKKPENTDKLVFAKRPGRNKQLSIYLGDSPYIETKTKQIRMIASELREQNHPTAWEHVEAIYDWVRSKIRYENGEIKSTTQALKDGTGDCEEMTGLFIAICRASDIPARCVWVPDHCYPEFYLEDEQGHGYWFPCQIAGERQFGEINEYRPIRQKGDRFKTPESKTYVRYLAETFTCKLKGSIGPAAPTIRPILDMGPLKAEIDQLQATATPSAGSAQLPAETAEMPSEDVEPSNVEDDESEPAGGSAPDAAD